MSTTTRCLFALGLSVSLFAACGDDDDDGFGVGGTGGRGGSGGRGGTGGSATAGAAGAAGSGDAGTGGTSAGTGGSGAGTGGSGAGTGGSGAGTGGSGVEPGDAGPDATVDEPDGGEDPVVDAGPEPVACGDLDDETEGAASSNETQQVIITRLQFVGPDAPGCTDETNGCVVVTFRAVAEAGFAFNSPQQLCTGSAAQGDCDAGVQFIDASGNGDASTALQEGEEISYTTGLGDVVTPAAGEIALVNGQPAVDEDPIIWAYVNWGGYESLPAAVGPNTGESLEEAAIIEGTDGVWTLGESVEVNGQNTLYATGDVVGQNDWFACSQ